MLTWLISNGTELGTFAKFIWRDWRGKRRTLAFHSHDRDYPEQAGLLKHGDWLMDGKWLAFYRNHETRPHREQCREWGIAFGVRCWEVSFNWFHRYYDSDEATALREAEEVEMVERREVKLTGGNGLAVPA